MSHRLLTTLCVTLCAFGLNGCFSDDPPTYGNSILDSGEECDGESYIAGICEEGMKDIYKEANPETRCINGKINKDVACIPKSVCGNGKLEEDEVCDGNEVSSTPCPEGEVLATEYNSNMCLQSCKLVAGSCIKEPAVCGNDKLEEDEVCDKNQVVDDPCGDGLFLNKPYDISMCSQSCEFIKDNCIKDESVCGDGKIENKEVCDYNSNLEDYVYALGVQCKPPTISQDDWPWFTVTEDYVQYNTCITEGESACKSLERYDTDGICSLKAEYSHVTGGIKKCQTSITEKDGQIISTVEIEGNSYSEGKTFEARIFCEQNIGGPMVMRLVKMLKDELSFDGSVVKNDKFSEVTVSKSTYTKPGTYYCITVIRSIEDDHTASLYSCSHVSGEPKLASQQIRDASSGNISYSDFIEYSFTVE